MLANRANTKASNRFTPANIKAANGLDKLADSQTDSQSCRGKEPGPPCGHGDVTLGYQPFGAQNDRDVTGNAAHGSAPTGPAQQIANRENSNGKQDWPLLRQVFQFIQRFF